MSKSLITLVIAALAITSCEKTSTVNVKQDYFYRLALVDLDLTTKYSEVLTTRIIYQLDIPSGANDGGDDDDKDDDDNKNFCKNNPNHPKCKPLPVLLEYFKLYNGGNYVVLSWKSVTEDNFKEYVIERSVDAINYKPIAFTKPKGASAYEYTDILKK